MIKFIKYKLLQLYSHFIARVLGEYAVGVILESDKILIAVKHTDMSVSRELIKKGQYSMPELNRLMSLITNQSNILIIGGHLGAIAIPLSQNANSVHVFEANPDTFKLLDWSIKLNVASNIHAYNLAVGEECGFIDFVKSKVFSGGAKRLPVFNRDAYLFDSPEIQKVPMISIDSFKPISNVKFDLCVIDIEGSEFYALKGMSEQLHKGIKNLIVEFIPHHIKNVSGCSVIDFCNLIKPHYNYFKLSNSKNVFKIEELESKLNYMYSMNEGDEGIWFFK